MTSAAYFERRREEGLDRMESCSDEEGHKSTSKTTKCVVVTDRIARFLSVLIGYVPFSKLEWSEAIGNSRTCGSNERPSNADSKSSPGGKRTAAAMGPRHRAAHSER